eukprot:SAG11_NODE_2683_length_3101_cov_3.117255_1_plen_623_part_00
MVGATLAALAQLWGAGPMEKLMPDTFPPGGASAATVSLEAARGEHQPFQVAVRPPSDDLRNASLSVYLIGAAAGVTFEVRRVGHVPVTAPTNAANRTGLFPDPLPLPCPPIGGGELLVANTTAGFWVTAVVAINAPPGLRHGRVELYVAGAVVAQIQLKLQVWTFAVSNLTLMTDSGFNNLDSDNWERGQRKQFPGWAQRQVLDAWTSELSSHRVNWMTYTQLLPQIRISVTDDPAGSVSVKLDSGAFESKARQLRAQGVTRIAFPMPTWRNANLAGQCFSKEPGACPNGTGTVDHRPFHGLTHEWSHCIMPNATWNFSHELPAVAVFAPLDSTEWAAAQPVLSPRFVRLFQAVYGAVAARLESAGLLSLVSTVWLKDEPEYNDPFTLAALVLLHELVAALHPQMTLYQTKLAVWPYLPKLNTTRVKRLEALVDRWFISGAPLGAAIRCQRGFPVAECAAQQPITRIASLRQRGKWVGYYDNSVPIIDQPSTRVRLFPWMIWLTDSGLWRPIQNVSAPLPFTASAVGPAGAGRYNPAAVTQAGLGLQGSVSWYCDNCGAGFHDPWAQPAEPSRHIPAGGGAIHPVPTRPGCSQAPALRPRRTPRDPDDLDSLGTLPERSGGC